MRHALRRLFILLSIVALVGAWLMFPEVLMVLPFFTIADVVTLNPINLFITAILLFFLCLYMAFCSDYITSREQQFRIVQSTKAYLAKRCEENRAWYFLCRIASIAKWCIIAYISYYLFGAIVLGLVFFVLML